MRAPRLLALMLALALPVHLVQLVGCSSGEGHPPPVTDLGSDYPPSAAGSGASQGEAGTTPGTGEPGTGGGGATDAGAADVTVVPSSGATTDVGTGNGTSGGIPGATGGSNGTGAGAGGGIPGAAGLGSNGTGDVGTTADAGNGAIVIVIP